LQDHQDLVSGRASGERRADVSLGAVRVEVGTGGIDGEANQLGQLWGEGPGGPWVHGHLFDYAGERGVPLADLIQGRIPGAAGQLAGIVAHRGSPFRSGIEDGARTVRGEPRLTSVRFALLD